ncbi:MAG: DUF3098 domain-containing protein [Bacteroidales bacterium]|nr:DUF3098 domain-containing protein [Bacteroidales bacterium]
MDAKKIKDAEPQTGFVLEKKNYIVMAIGFGIMILGFFLMAGGKSTDPKVFNPEIFSFRRITLAPVVLLIGFITEIFAIMWRPKK